jgi:hypothetical protein
MAEYKVEWVEIKGKSIPAERVVCPQCNVLDLNTDFDTTEEPWKATCSKGHEWAVKTVAEA